MGTDIHLSWQIRKNGKWEVVAGMKDSDGDRLLDYRDYDNFALLADVRNYCEITPICKPKGFPVDMAGIEHPKSCFHEEEMVSLYAGYIYGKFGGVSKERPEAWLGWHDFTYLSLKDFLQYRHWKKMKTSYVYKEVIPAMKKLAEDNGLSPCEVRVVMGFDS